MYNRVRYRNIDFLKGLGVLLVILGHTSLPGNCRSLIYFFHMPLFFFISGYLSGYMCVGGGIELKAFVKKKFKKLIIPYYFFVVLQVVISVIAQLCTGGLRKELVYKIISGIIGVRSIIPNATNNEIGLLWFLPALFFIETIFFLINRYSKKPWLSIMTLLGIGIIYAYTVGEKCRLPYCADSAILALPFYGTGNLVKDNEKRILNWYMSNKNRILVYGIIVVGLLGAYITHQNIDLIRLQIGIFPIFYVGSSLLCTGLWLFFLPATCAPIEWIGRNSLYYLVFQEYGTRIYNLISNVVASQWYKWFLLQFAITYIVTVLLIYAYRKLQNLFPRLP